MKSFFKRLIQGVISLFVLMTFSFFLFKSIPGSPFDEEVILKSQVRERLEVVYGLNQSLPTQYGLYLKNFISGEGGESMRYPGKSVFHIIQSSFGVTFRLASFGLFFSVFMSLLILFLMTEFPVLKKAEFYGSILTSSVPVLLLGPLLILSFSLGWGLLPVAYLDSWQSYVLPVILLGFRPTAVLLRLMKTQLDRNLTSDYARTFRSLGFSERQVQWRWCLRSSVIPALTYLGTLISGLFSGSILVEMLFALPGLGSEYLDALLNRDFPLIMGLTLFYGALILTISFLVDLLIEWADPRVRVADERVRER